jgi:hypothetical protein
MITRAQMPRQLRGKGGITNVVPRTNYIFGGIKDRIRKLIPNELADVAVKAAPFVAPFNAPVAALMRGIGRFDQRGSISDAVKQGLGTFAFGKVAQQIPGTQDYFGKGMEGAKALAGDIRTKAGGLFEGGGDTPKFTGKDKPGFLRKAAEETIGKIPVLKNLSPKVQEKLLAGTITSAGNALYEYFTGGFEPQEPGESLEEYMARRRESVKSQMRQVMDSYYTPLRNPEYAAMTPEQKDNFIDGIVGQGMAMGGRAGYQTGGITMANTLAENIRRNLANQAAVAQQFQAARSRLPGYVAPQRIAAPKAAPIKIEEPDLPISKPTPIPGGDVQSILPVMPDQPVMLPMEPPRKIIPEEKPIINQPPPVKIQPMPIDAPTKIIIPEEPPRKIIPEEGTIGPITKLPIAPDPDTPIDELIKPIMPTLPVEPMTDQDVLEGYAKFKEQNPGAGMGPGLAVMIYGRLPDGTPLTFTNSAQASAFNQYLESIGQPPFERSFSPVGFKDDSGEKSLSKLTKLDDPMMTGFDYSKEINWSPGQPAPEGYRVVNMMGDEFLERKFPSKEEVAGLPRVFSEGGRVRFSEGANIKIKLKQIGYEDTLLDKMSLKELRDLLDSEKGTFTDQGTYREPAKKGGMPTGIMKTNKAGVMERDYRDKGGFVPVGIKEKADDVPAMLSKNEFVFTADAVRGAGNGSIEKGAQRMYDTMKNLEKRVT